MAGGSPLATLVSPAALRKPSHSCEEKASAEVGLLSRARWPSEELSAQEQPREGFAAVHRAAQIQTDQTQALTARNSSKTMESGSSHNTSVSYARQERVLDQAHHVLHCNGKTML